MSNRRITSTTGKGGERVLKGLLSKGERIGKLKDNAVEALLRTILKEAQREHVTLAGSYMTQLMDTHTLMKELIVKSQPYISGKMGVLCDREFFTVEYIKVLHELNRKFLMPARKNKRIKKIIKETKERERLRTDKGITQIPCIPC